jgi:hypothetical protein
MPEHIKNELLSLSPYLKDAKISENGSAVENETYGVLKKFLSEKSRKWNCLYFYKRVLACSSMKKPSLDL